MRSKRGEYKQKEKHIQKLSKYFKRIAKQQNKNKCQ